MTPAFKLYLAIQSGETDTARQLLADFPTLLHERVLGETWLHHAAEAGNQDLISELIRLGVDLNSQLEDAPITPLDRAAKNRRVAVVTQLLNAGAVVRATTTDCGGTLIAAVNGGSIEVVRLLLDRGADPHVLFGPYKNNALSQAIKCGHHEIADLLRSRGCQLPTIHST
jgi:ankyrin repeat protein